MLDGRFCLSPFQAGKNLVKYTESICRLHRSVGKDRRGKIMNWKKFTIHTTAEAEDFVCALLQENGIEGIEIEDSVPVPDADRQGGVFEELQPDLPTDDASSRISFYVEEEKEFLPLLDRVRAGLEELCSLTKIGEGNITTDETKEEDWINNWKQYFSSFTIGDLYIKPTWEAEREEHADKILIEIDPGVSFGTGKHESTQLCLRQLQKYIRPQDKVLDVGCGSGILSIAALKLGAGHVTGTDIDPDCMDSVRDNMKQNHIPEDQGTFYVGNLIDDAALQEKVGYQVYDVVAANILADIIIAMMPAIVRTLKPGAVFISSGIIDFKAPEVRQAIASAGLVPIEENAQGEWVNITARRP